MIKKNLKKYYFNKEEEDRSIFLQRLYESAQLIHNRTLTGCTSNWIVVGQDVANHLNTLYPNWSTQESVNYTNQWCGTTYTTMASGMTHQPVYSAGTRTINFSG
jgi:hypothetical protein